MLWVEAIDGQDNIVTTLRKVKDLKDVWTLNRDGKRVVLPRRLHEDIDNEQKGDEDDPQPKVMKTGQSTYLTGLRQQQEANSIKSEAIAKATQLQHTERIEALSNVTAVMAKGVLAAAEITSRGVVTAASIAAQANPNLLRESPVKSNADVQRKNTLLGNFPNDVNKNSDSRVSERIERFLRHVQIFEVDIIRAVNNCNIDLDTLLRWASGNDKKYFTQQLRLSGLAHPPYNDRLFYAINEALNGVHD